MDPDTPEQTVRLVVDPCSEEKCIGVVLFLSVEGYAPQTINDDGLAGWIGKLAQKSSRGAIKGIDTAIAEVADE